MRHEYNSSLNEKFVLHKVSAEQWDEFALKWKPNIPAYPASFVQSGNMANYLEKNGQTYFPLIMKNAEGESLAGGLFSVYPAMKIFKVAKCNQGPLIDYNDSKLLIIFFELVKDFLKKQGIIHLSITPNIECKNDINKINQNLILAGFTHDGFQNTYINGVGRWFFVKDFMTIKNPKDLWNSYTGKARNHINKAKKYSIHCLEAKDIEQLKIFSDLIEHTAERRHFSFRSAEYYKQFLHYFNQNSAKAMIILAYIDPKESIENLKQKKADLTLQCKQLEADVKAGIGKNSAGKLKSRLIELDSYDKNIETITSLLDEHSSRIYLSGATFVTYNNEMTYLFSGSYEKYFGLCASQLIQHYAQTKALEYGIKRYNYYGTMGKHSGQEDEGILNFKKGFGGRLLEQPGNYSLTIHNLWGLIYQKFFK